MDGWRAGASGAKFDYARLADHDYKHGWYAARKALIAAREEATRRTGYVFEVYGLPGQIGGKEVSDGQR